jgi:hypothetical protein
MQRQVRRSEVPASEVAMSKERIMGRPWRNRGVLLLSSLLALTACGLDKVEFPDFFDGPSELGTSVTLTANPDILTADGFSTSSIVATVRDQNGQLAPNRRLFFAIADESGRFADIGTLRDAFSGALLGSREAFSTTNGQGIAQVIYQTPPRTDATANQSVLVTARPVGTDAQAALHRAVRIELRSAEPRLFPPNPDNDDPNCNFIVEAPDGFKTNVAILFQTTSNDPDGVIVRYEWDFGDGTRSYAPDNAKVYRLPGTYVVFHRVIDDDGGQAACSVTLTIQ